LSGCAKFKQFQKYSPGVPRMWVWPLHCPFLFRIFSPFKKKIFNKNSPVERGDCLLSGCAKFKQFQKYSPGVPCRSVGPLHRPFLFRFFFAIKKKFLTKNDQQGGFAVSVAVQNSNNSQNIPQVSPACGHAPCIICFFFAFLLPFKKKSFTRIHQQKGGLSFEWLCKIQTIPKIFPRGPLHVSGAPASSVPFSHFFAILKQIFDKNHWQKGGCLLSGCAKFKQF
jgi:hypothetical protein